MNCLPTQLAHQLESPATNSRFLIEGLWSLDAVGIIGGEPKCCKSFLALDMAMAVASGRDCLQRFPVESKGPVVFFAAEDALCILRERIEGICRTWQMPIESLALHVITVPSLRLDVERDRYALRETLLSLRPRMLVLDPFVRLHRINENLVEEVAPLLAYLRQLQRELALSVVLVHHARKGGHARAGQALRGSSELHAWGDSNLYLRRDRDRLILTVEHRAAGSPDPIELELHADRDRIALRVVDTSGASGVAAHVQSQDQRVLSVLQRLGPCTRRALRDACKIRSETLGEILTRLVAQGLLTTGHEGYRLVVAPES